MSARLRSRHDPPFRLGAAEDVDSQSWNEYLLALKARSQSAYGGLLGSYRTLRDVRQRLGLPLVAQGEAIADPGGALLPSDERRILELGAIVDVTGKAIDDVVAGKRKAAFSAGPDEILIEQLTTDANRVVSANGEARLVDAKTGAPVEVTGTIGFVPVALAVLVAAGTIVTVGAVYLAIKAVEAMKVVVQEKTARTLSDNATKLVESGKATPEQASAMNDAILKGQADLNRSRAEENKSTTSDITDAVKTVAIVGALIAVLYFGAQVIPAFAPKREAA